MADEWMKRYRGDTQAETFTVQDSAGSAVDCTSATAAFTVKEHWHDAQSSAIVAKTTSADISWTDASAGEGSIAWAASDTTSIAISGDRKTFVSDIEVTLAAGTIITGAADFVLLADVTTPT